MGNKLCAPLWKKHYRDDISPWKKDAHLLRLWAEIFHVEEWENEVRWERISDDVVPVNIICVQETPDTIFQISAYNRHVEKIFDVRLRQPGTKINIVSETFVQWKDSRTLQEWGLNFTSIDDVRRFRDCCSIHSPTHRINRQTTSSSSLKLSPPKRLRSKRGISAPTSPVGTPRRALSTPDDLSTNNSLDDDDEGGFRPSTVEAVATLPRGRSRHIPDARTIFGPQGEIIKPQSNNSVYDNVSYGGAPRRATKYDRYDSGSNSLRMYRPHSDYGSKTIQEGEHFKPASIEARDHEQSSAHQNSNGNIIRSPSKQSETPSNVYQQQRQSSNKGGLLLPGSDPNSGASHDISPLTPPHNSHSSSSPDWPLPPEPLTPTTPKNPVCVASFDSGTLERMLRSLPASPRKGTQQQVFSFNNINNTNTTNTPMKQNIPPSDISSDNNDTDEEDGACDVEGDYYDNVEIHKMLNKPIIPDDHIQEPLKRLSPRFHQEDTYIQNVQQDPRLVNKQNRENIEYELHLRNQCVRDSYPDSGIGGMTYSGTGSTKSADSLRSSTLPPGLPGLGKMTKASHPASSSGGSSSISDKQSDLLHPYGSEGTGSSSGRRRGLTSSEVSDDEGDSNSSIHTAVSESHGSFVRQSGAIRKAGWLNVKNWLIHKKRKVELASKRSWKKYWVCLKGTTLLFFTCDEQSSLSEDTAPRHMLVIEGSITQAVPEHPKRDNIFSLSTAFGDAYLFQAPTQIELENWVTSIHSACASLFARQHGKDNTLKLLRSEIQKLDNGICSDIKMKKMADLQLTVVTDPKSKAAIVKQINQWEENLEKIYIEQYRLRCYMASLQGSELPNPKNLLTNVSKATKSLLGRLGVFTVTSFHALVCARSPMSMTLYGKSGRKGQGSKVTKQDALLRSKKKASGALSPTQGSVYKVSDIDENAVVDFTKHNVDNPEELGSPRGDPMTYNDNLIRVKLPNNQSVIVGLTQENMTMQEVLEAACNKRQLNPGDHFIRLKLQGLNNYLVPEKSSYLQQQPYEGIEVCAKTIFQIELSRNETIPDFGFEIEAELAEDTERDDELCVFVSEMKEGALGQTQGLIVGDEILVINGRVVSDLDMVYIEALLQECPTVCLTIRSCRTERPTQSTLLMRHADVYIDNMMCPPPPTQSRISDKIIGDLIIPAPTWVDSGGRGDQPTRMVPHDLSNKHIDTLLKGTEQVTVLCRDLYGNLYDGLDAKNVPMAQPMSGAQRVRKVILELIDTERQYVKDLNCLIERYLEPLQAETFLSNDDIEQLFGNIQEIVAFQRQFLLSLEEAVELEPDFLTIADTRHFREDRLRRILFSLGGSFLYYANHFKLYSSFCASHSKAQKVLNPDDNTPLKEFLRARNPKQQHSATLESYLIKPIQRILKYPLLLRQLKSLTNPQSDEHNHLSEALKGMEAVAEHINEMQKIYEEYGGVFDELMKGYKETHSLSHSKIIDLNVGELQMYGNVEWMNAHENIGKIKKGMEVVSTCFVFRTGVVLLCRERMKKNSRKMNHNKNQLPNENGSEITRFHVFIPVYEVQVRSTPGSEGDTHHMWDLVHLKSETEGRPEKVFQMANGSFDAKNDFIKTTRQIIRESVRRMTVPPRLRAGLPPLPNRQVSAPSGERSLGSSSRRKGQRSRDDIQRHSMNLDEHISILDHDGNFRTRSQTYTDLHNPDGISQNSLSSSNMSRHDSARLLYSSSNPLTYASNTILEDVGSPVWKPRQLTVKDINEPKSPDSQRSQRLNTTVFNTPGYGDYSSALYNDHNGSMTLTPPNAYFEQVDTDTEC
ncbi:unnamed protein product [Owenia fusiformis]|uniref:Uncharacterized protein n=1 Tax=Owenia fusiformis TaxID=6347 RepID=A0A8J1TDL8_OWEFU|nr:unnamed protein product [Owenia fusiformis]